MVKLNEGSDVDGYGKELGYFVPFSLRFVSIQCNTMHTHGRHDAARLAARATRIAGLARLSQYYADWNCENTIAFKCFIHFVVKHQVA